MKRRQMMLWALGALALVLLLCLLLALLFSASGPLIAATLLLLIASGALLAVLLLNPHLGVESGKTVFTHQGGSGVLEVSEGAVAALVALSLRHFPEAHAHTAESQPPASQEIALALRLTVEPLATQPPLCDAISRQICGNLARHLGLGPQQISVELFAAQPKNGRPPDLGD